MGMIGFSLVLFAFFGLPIIVCALLGYSKGRRWYWFALFGFLSLLGLLIAMAIPVRPRDTRQRRHPADPGIKLLVQSASPSGERLGAIQVVVEAIADEPEQAPIAAPLHTFDLRAAADALRHAAAARGANAVENVEFLRTQPQYWTLRPTHRIIARGTAVQLHADEYAATPSNAVEIWRGKEAVDPEYALFRYQLRSGMTTLCWSVIMAVTLFAQHQQHAAYSPLEYLALWLVVDGVLLFTWHTPKMLLIDGVTLLTLGVLRMSITNIPAYGLGVIATGIWSIISYLNYERNLKIYYAIRARVQQLQPGTMRSER